MFSAEISIFSDIGNGNLYFFFLVFFGDATVSLGEYILHSLATRSFEQRPQPGARRQQQQQRASFWKARDVDGSRIKTDIS